jgi:hypothetical protein
VLPDEAQASWAPKTRRRIIPPSALYLEEQEGQRHQS